MPMNLCPVCNAQISRDTQVCPKCGHDLKLLQQRISPESEIRQLLIAGKKIEAIKIYREATGMGLKESKDAVEIVERELRAAGQLPQKSSGCLGLLSLLVLLPLLFLFLLR